MQLFYNVMFKKKNKWYDLLVINCVFFICILSCLYAIKCIDIFHTNLMQPTYSNLCDMLKLFNLKKQLKLKSP